METINHRLSRFRGNLTNEFGFEPKLADGVTHAVSETVLLIHNSIDAVERHIGDKFTTLERQLEKWHYEDEAQLHKHLTQLRRIEADIHKKITQDFIHSDEIWWRTIVAALSGSGVAIVLMLFLFALLKGLLG